MALEALWQAVDQYEPRGAEGEALPDTGDVVEVAALGETWVVAYCEGGYVAACGYPLSRVAVEKVRVVERANERERRVLLYELAAMSEPDPRRDYARRRLAAIKSATTGDASSGPERGR
jgi:hypothetical protein